MNNQFPWWVSSTGQGVAQRIVSIVALVLPILSLFGINIAPATIQIIVNAGLILVFAVWQAWAWARAAWNKENQIGKYAPQAKSALPPQNQ